MRTSRAIFGLFAAIGFGCSDGPDTGSHIGNPATFEMTVVRSELLEVPEINDATGRAYMLRSASIEVRDIKLDLPDEIRCSQVEDVLDGGAYCEPGEAPGENAEIVLDGPFVVNLLEASSVPSLNSYAIPALNYRRVDYRVRSESDVSFRMEAEFDYESQPVVLELALDVNEDARVENPSLVLEPNGTLSVALDAERWLEGVDPADCIQGGVVTDGRLFIDEGSECDVQRQIKTQIKNASRLNSTSP